MPNLKSAANQPSTLAARILELAARAKQLNADAEALAEAIALEQSTKFARGTKRDMQPIARVDDVSATPLYLEMKTMLERRPMTLREVIEATKAEENKVKVVLMRMQREEIGLVNMGNRYRALWYIPSESFRKRMRTETE